MPGVRCLGKDRGHWALNEVLGMGGGVQFRSPGGPSTLHKSDAPYPTSPRLLGLPPYWGGGVG